MNDAFGPKPWPASARYIFSFIDPINTRGLVCFMRFLIFSLSVFFPATRATANLQGRPNSFSKKFRIPLVYVSLATMPKLAVAKKSCVTERQRSHTGLMVECFSFSMKPSTSILRISPNFLRNLVVLSIPIGACKYGFPNSSASPLPNSLYITIFASAFTSFDISAM